MLICAEVGAIGMALCSERAAASPLALASVKACYGHTEGTAGEPNADCACRATEASWSFCFLPTMALCSWLLDVAGASGLQMAVLSLASHAPTQHLRGLNPYVTAALGDWQRPAVLPRQLAGCCHSSSGAVAGAGLTVHLMPLTI